MIYSRSLKKSQTVKTVWLFYFMQASENIAAMALNGRLFCMLFLLNIQ